MDIRREEDATPFFIDDAAKKTIGSCSFWGEGESKRRLEIIAEEIGRTTDAGSACWYFVKN